jgi:ankyrin repeat protein
LNGPDRRTTFGGMLNTRTLVSVFVLVVALVTPAAYAQPAIVTAAAAGDVDRVRAALQAGAPADTVDDAGVSALAHAVYGDRAQVVRLLLSAGASPYRLDARGRSPWMWAAYLGRDEVVRLFVAAGVDVDAAPPGGPTALMLASLAGHAPVVRLLITSGADVGRRDGDGNTAEAWARDRGNEEIVQLLRSAAATPTTASAAAAAAAAAARPAAAAPAPAGLDAEGWPLALDTAAGAAYLSPVERAVVLELNRARTNPARYAELYIKPMTRQFRGDLLVTPGETAVRTSEGVTAVEECVRALAGAQPVGPLASRPGLSRAAADHARDQGPRGAVGHEGGEGSDPGVRIRRYETAGASAWGENIGYGYGDARRIVISLLVDDGVASRGHRTNIMNNRFDSIGVAVGPHAAYRSMCVMDFGKY